MRSHVPRCRTQHHPNKLRLLSYVEPVARTTHLYDSRTLFTRRMSCSDASRNLTFTKPIPVHPSRRGTGLSPEADARYGRTRNAPSTIVLELLISANARTSERIMTKSVDRRWPYRVWTTSERHLRQMGLEQ